MSIEKYNGSDLCEPPSRMYLEVCNYCNLKCPSCPTTHNCHAHQGVMTFDTFNTIFKKISHCVKWINLFNYGEPLMNKDIVDIIKCCSRSGIGTRIDTNFSLKDLSQEEAEDLVRSGLTLLVVSADGASQKTYGMYRVGGNFERVLNNMKKVISAKNRFSDGAPTICWKFLINRHNEHEIEKARAIAKEIGVCLSFEIMENFHNRSWDSEIYNHETGTLPDPYVPFGSLRSGDGKGGATVGALNPRNAGFLHKDLRRACREPFSELVVNYNGDVLPCCEIVDTLGDGTLVVGNLLNQSLEEVWNGERMKACRRYLLNYGDGKQFDSVCEHAPCPVGKNKKSVAQKHPVFQEREKRKVAEIVHRVQEEGLKVVFFGAGQLAIELLTNSPFSAVKLVGVVDSDLTRTGEEFFEYKIFPPTSIDALGPDLVVIASKAFSCEMEQFLSRECLRNVEIFKF
ncbi:MAG: SPASM domain-containing protein [Desulfuromonadaceae bacterium]|nr:SPASM domain-containing protein [Desulfuromonadaceae bacterium]